MFLTEKVGSTAILGSLILPSQPNQNQRTLIPQLGIEGVRGHGAVQPLEGRLQVPAPIIDSGSLLERQGVLSIEGERTVEGHRGPRVVGLCQRKQSLPDVTRRIVGTKLEVSLRSGPRLRGISRGLDRGPPGR